MKRRIVFPNKAAFAASLLCGTSPVPSSSLNRKNFLKNLRIFRLRFFCKKPQKLIKKKRDGLNKFSGKRRFRMKAIFLVKRHLLFLQSLRHIITENKGRVKKSVEKKRNWYRSCRRFPFLCARLRFFQRHTFESTFP